MKSKNQDNSIRNRIAVISSPRVGNSWIRSVVAGALGMQEVAVHNIKDIKDSLPEKVFLQIHWYREPNFQSWLTENDFKILCIARHPLDILLSVLHYVRYEPGTARWLEGNVLIPKDLGEASPTDKQFVNYANSFGAENLLSISYQWWHEPSAIKIRYEDCVADPVGALGGLIQRLGGESDNVNMWLERLSLEKMRATPNRHGWQGQPRLYKSLIPYFSARRIFNRHKNIFNFMNYDIPPYFLTKSRAIDNWNSII